MYILGVSAYFHDSSACILKDGKVVAAAEEERFTRKKHDTGFPIKAIRYCMEEAGITIKDVDYVAFYEKPILKFERIMSQFLESFPRGFTAFYNTMPSWINEKLRVQWTIRRKLKYKRDILFIDHHLAHAPSSFFMSPFKEAGILTVDGVGEWTTTTMGHAKGNEIMLDKEIVFPHSLGLLYSAVTAYLGFKVNNDEYKVMGLAPYGKPVYVDKFRKIIQVREDGSYKLDMDYFVYHYKMSMPSKKFVQLFGPARKKGGEMEQKHKDIAASLQKVLEDVLFRMLNHLQKETRSKNLCMAGGVALNSVANGKIMKNTKFRDIYVIPAAGDGGTSVGAAAYVYYSLLKKPKNFVMEHAYTGPSFSTEYIRNFLESKRIKYTEFRDEKELLKTTAKLIHENHVIGWFQGRMEFGPRALGARSILSNPTNPEMKDILNLKVKHREKFRPFAPVVCADDAKKFFETDKIIPIPTDFMLMVYPIKKSKQKLLPAVTHVDGSGRLQTIRRKHNSLYYDLIKEFGKLSKVPVLVNTSFNIRGEPIVCRPEDAYKCMMGTEIDYLVMDRFLVRRANNPRDMWDSEKTINE